MRLFFTTLILLTGSFSNAFACTFPDGVVGEIVFNETYNVLQYCDDNDQWIAMVGGDPTLVTDYDPNAVTFNGVNYLDQVSLSESDPSLISGSFWFKRDPNNIGFAQTFIHYSNAGAGYFRVRLDGGNKFHIDGRQAVTNSYKSVLKSNMAMPDGKWYHVIFSLDTTNRALDQLYINDVNVTDSTSDTLTAFGGGDEMSIGAFAPTIGTIKYYGDIADLWIDFDNKIDFSVEANRRAFISASGKAVYLGSDGSLPTGSAPEVFLTGDTDNWHINKGTGGGFNENGALTDAATTPNFPRTEIVPNGLIGHWRLDETSGTTAYDSSGNGFNGTMEGGLSGTFDSTVGVIDTSLEFDGTDDLVRIPHNAAFDFGDVDFSYSFWVKANFSNINHNVRIINKGTSGNTTCSAGKRYETYYVNPDSRQEFRFAIDDGVNKSEIKIDPVLAFNGGWQHFTFVRNTSSNLLKVYRNGILVGDAVDSSTGLDNTCDLMLAKDDDGEGGAAQIELDDFRIYDRALNEGEIRELYAARDGIRYNENHRRYEYFDGNRFVSMTPDWAEVDEGPIYSNCFSQSAPCADGTYIVGYSPDDGKPMYMTDSTFEASRTWNDGSMDWFRTYINDSETGEANTAALVAATDIGSPYEAAGYCHGLSAHTYDNWYLPAADEAALFYNDGDFVGDIRTGTDKYWTSSEPNSNAGSNRALLFRMDNNIVSTGDNKDNNDYVRCVRKSPLVVSGTGGLVGHWKFDEISGTTLIDSLGNGYDGVYENVSEVQSRTGAVGTAAGFIGITSDGAGTYAYVPHSPALDIAFPTIAGWVKYDAAAGGQGVLAGRRFNSSPPYNSFTISKNGGTGVKCKATDGAATSATASGGNLTYGRWHHIACTYDGSAIRIYIDGVLKESADFAGPIGYSTRPFQFAIENMGQNHGELSGALDDWRFYDRPLSAAEIQKLFQMGSPVGQTTALPQGCPNIGDVCDDGTVYIGLSTDGTTKMFTADISYETSLPWNNGNTSGYVEVAGLLAGEGEPNTAILVTTDADSALTDFQPHQAAYHCYNLNAHGADDWYLPEGSGLDKICNVNGLSGETWLSSDRSDTNANYRFPSCGPGGGGPANKQSSFFVRCVRKGPAPRCANPYGLEGQMIYNTTYDVVQFCDGARWIAIGKYGP